jgi:hypothetical protein
MTFWSNVPFFFQKYSLLERNILVFKYYLIIIIIILIIIIIIIIIIAVDKNGYNIQNAQAFISVSRSPRGLREPLSKTVASKITVRHNCCFKSEHFLRHRDTLKVDIMYPQVMLRVRTHHSILGDC